MTNGTITKTAFTAGGLLIITILGDIINQVLGLLIALATLALLDYGTGLAGAWKRGKVSSRVGINGILRKACYGVVIALALALDYLITLGAGKAGMAGFVSPYMTAVVALWLCANEGISILENLTEIGVPFPEFIKSAFVRAKESAQKAGEKSDREESR